MVSAIEVRFLRFPIAGNQHIAKRESTPMTSTEPTMNTNPLHLESGAAHPVAKPHRVGLKDIADEISGTYVPVNASSALADQVSAKASKQWRTTVTAKKRTRTTPVVWPLAIALAVLLAWEFGAWIATSRRLL